jgi:protein-L-isoaspartate(D-aspartate) O-methyltransferase
MLSFAAFGLSGGLGMVMDYELARHNMIEQQIRPWDVLDHQVLDLLFRVKREDFVPDAYRLLAFADIEIPLGHGESMLAPKIEARILQEIALKPTDKVLEVGTGSGYFSALLASQAAQVYSVEIHPNLNERAAARLSAHGLANVVLEVGDAAQGWETGAPYDVIVLTGSTPVLPEAFARNLTPGGRLFAIVGQAPAMQAQLITCPAPGHCRTTTLFETSVKPLVNALQPENFVF